MREKLLYECIIPLNPATKKNNNRILYSKQKGQYFIAPSVRYEKYQKECGWLLKRKIATINEPIEIEYKFYRKNEIRCDLTNLEEAIDDILVHYRIIADDSFKIIKSHDGSRVYIDKQNPRTEIRIYKYKEED